MATDNLNPENSPNGTGGNGGVRRLNKLPLIFLGIGITAVLAGILYALNSRGASKTETEAKPGNNTIGNNAMVDKLLSGIGDGVVDSLPGEKIVIDNTKDLPDLPSETEKELPSQPTLPQQSPPVDEEAERIKAMVRDFRQRNFYDAIIARTAAEETPNYEDKDKQTANDNRQLSSNPQIAALMQSLVGQGISGQQKIDGMESLLEQRDPNLRLRKDAFAADKSNPYSYSTSTRQAQLTPFEVRVGTIIPAVMVSGINSDLPGDIIAQVSQDVRDTKTGRFVLIPQGSKLIGRYDSHIAMGQERVMIAWYRLQFPDASTFNLDNMGAVDLAGYAGMHDQVNNHTWRIFKNAFLLSVIGAGAQIAIGDGGSDEKSPINTAKSEMGRQFGQVGTEMIKRNMNVQPTLEIRPGYRFNVMVNKDLILSPYQ